MTKSIYHSDIYLWHQTLEGSSHFFWFLWSLYWTFYNVLSYKVLPPTFRNKMHTHTRKTHTSESRDIIEIEKDMKNKKKGTSVLPTTSREAVPSWISTHETYNAFSVQEIQKSLQMCWTDLLQSPNPRPSPYPCGFPLGAPVSCTDKNFDLKNLK